MFWLSCDFFSILCDVSCQKGSLPANAAVKSKLYKACQCNAAQKTPDNIAHEKLYAMLSQRLQTTRHTKNPGNAVWTTSGVSIYIYYILGLSHQKNCLYLINLLAKASNSSSTFYPLTSQTSCWMLSKQLKLSVKTFNLTSHFLQSVGNKIV